MCIYIFPIHRRLMEIIHTNRGPSSFWDLSLSPGLGKQKLLFCFVLELRLPDSNFSYSLVSGMLTSCLGVPCSRSSMGGTVWQAESNCRLRRHEYTTWFWLCHFTYTMERTIISKSWVTLEMKNTSRGAWLGALLLFFACLDVSEQLWVINSHAYRISCLD